MLKIIIAGLLAVPCLLLLIVTAPLVAILAIPPLLLLIYRKAQEPPGADQRLPDHVVIAGGSSGIGLCIAQESVRRGVARVTLLARNAKKLEECKALLEKQQQESGKTCKIETVSVSVSDHVAMQKVAVDLKINTDKDRVVVFNCAGISYTTEFEKVPVEQYRQLVETNQLGSMYLVRAFLPVMKHGCIVLTSSAAGQVGVYGYSVYCPTKYALRGFAEALHAELIKSHPDVSIQLAFPADTNTPGLDEERKMMPEITKKLNESGGMEQPEDTARKMVDAAFAKNPKFAVYFNFDGWMLANLTAGMSPVCNISDALAQVALVGIFRFVSLFVINDWWRVIRAFDDSGEKKEK